MENHSGFHSATVQLECSTSGTTEGNEPKKISKLSKPVVNILRDYLAHLPQVFYLILPRDEQNFDSSIFHHEFLHVHVGFVPKTD